MTRILTVVVPGDIQTRTGGYEYDRRMIDALRHRGWTVAVRELDAGFPHPSEPARQQAGAVLRAEQDDALVLIDGLALGALPEEAEAEGARLRIVALVHHPLALETGLDTDSAARLFESERRALGAARLVIVTSGATARRVEGYGVSADRVRVVSPGTEAADLGHGSGGKSVHLLSVGSLVPRKGYALLLQALASMRDLPWQLTLAGSRERSPATAAALVVQARELGLESRVAFTGELSERALAAQYAAADVFVLPTLYEGYGMVVAEAVARGLPVVATDTGGIADMLGGDAGIVCPPGDGQALSMALRRVIGDPSARAALAAGARRVRARLPSWADQAALMETALLEAPAR